jgi:hypothetical protein
MIWVMIWDAISVLCFLMMLHSVFEVCGRGWRGEPFW